MNELMTKDSQEIRNCIKSIDSASSMLKELSETVRPALNGERFLTDRELSDRIKISRRTLQDYRNEGRIPYIQLGGKILYRESDIEKLLKDGYMETFNY